MVNGRQCGAAQRRAVFALRVTLVVLLVAVPLGVIALLAWLLVSVATEREQSAGTGLLWLGVAMSTFVQERGSSGSRWRAAGFAPVAVLSFMDAAVSQRPLAYAHRAMIPPRLFRT